MTKETQQTAPAGEPTLRRLAADADHRLALFGPVLLSVWIQETKIDALRAMEKHIEECANGAPGGRLGFFVVVETGAALPSEVVRAELARIRRRSAIAFTALVYEGNGFSAALVRGITTGLNLMSDTTTHIFADVPSATRWVETTTPQYGAAVPLESALRALRSAAG
jgi:hypothetical protein